MESLHFIIITGLCCFLAGGVIGAFLTRRLASSEKKNRDLEKHLHEKQDEIKNYRREVTEHFLKTSNLLNNLTETYRDIHNHLAQSANHLSNTGNQNQPIIQAIPEPKIYDNNESLSPKSPPLDYAPKSTPYDKGTLTDDYDLEKVELNEKPIEDYAQVIAENAKVKT